MRMFKLFLVSALIVFAIFMSYDIFTNGIIFRWGNGRGFDGCERYIGINTGTIVIPIITTYCKGIL